MAPTSQAATRGQQPRLLFELGFKGAKQQRKVGVLSGGERNRVHLAKLLQDGGNVILLDEPSNDPMSTRLPSKMPLRASLAAPWSSAILQVPRPARDPHPRL